MFTACVHDEDLGATANADIKPPANADKTPLVVIVKMTEVDISGGKQLRIGDSQLLIGEELVATWSGDTTAVYKATVTVNGVAVASGAMLHDA